MILPAKHIRLEESVFGFGGHLLGLLEQPKNVDELWRDFSKINNTDRFPTFQDFDDFIIAIDFLYALGSIKILDNHKICYEAH